MTKIILLLLIGFYSVLSAQEKKNSSDFIGKPENAISIESSTNNLRADNNSTANANAFSQNDIELEKLTNELYIARGIGDLETANKIQDKISILTGQPKFIMNETAVGMKLENKPVENNMMIGITRINTAPAKVISLATCTEKYSGKIWVISTEDSQTSGGDTAKIYYSTSGGQSWIRLMTIFFQPGSAYKYLPNDLDIESITDGANTVLYVSAGVNKGGKTTVLYKFASDGGGLKSYFTISAPANQFYGGRVCSDNAKYDAAAYVYYAFTQDSTLGVNNHTIKMNLFCITAPYDENPTISTRRVSSAGYASYVAMQPDSAYSYCDIAAMDSINIKELIYTVQSFNKLSSGLNNLYFSTTSNTGLSLSRSFQVVQLVPSSNPRLATNGGLYSPYIFCAFLSKQNNFDVNPRIVYSTNIGSSWNESLVSGSQDTVYSFDIIGVTNGIGKFYFAYNRQLAGVKESYYASYSYPNFSFALVKMNSLECDNFLGTIRAGYKTTGPDSCLAIWGGLNGNNMYASVGCTGAFIGVNNEGSFIPDKFILSQNYPNPFNPATKINYNLKKDGFVNLVVYDNLGKEIRTLVNKNQSSGNHEVEFNFDGLESGVYYYRINVEGYSETKKMIMMK